MSPLLGPLDDVVAVVGHVPTRVAVTDASCADRVATRLGLPRPGLPVPGPGRTPAASALELSLAVLAQDAWVVVLDHPAAVPLVAQRAELVVRVLRPARSGLRVPGRSRDPRRRVDRRLDALAADAPDLALVVLRTPEQAESWLTRLPRAI